MWQENKAWTVGTEGAPPLGLVRAHNLNAQHLGRVGDPSVSCQLPHALPDVSSQPATRTLHDPSV